MTVTREELLAAVEEEESTEFLRILAKHNMKDDPLDLEELLPTLSKKQQEDLWSHLQMKNTTALLGIDTHKQADDQNDADDPFAVMLGILTVAIATTTQEDAYIPESLFETAVVLNGILSSLPPEQDKLCNSIARLCEVWWIKDMAGKEHLAAETLVYLLARSLGDSATSEGVKRVRRMRNILPSIDIQSDSSATLRSLLLQTLTSVHYIKLDEGRKFLSFLFSLNISFIESLHKTIKNYLPDCHKKVLHCYGAIYFDAWKLATGPALEKIEQYCIQDLMYHAVHAKLMAPSLRKVLDYFHKQKKQRGVDEMLYRLYDPILWRSLHVANGNVRSNAALLLVDAFPLGDPELRVEEMDSIMQKQFDELDQLLYDPVPAVRNIAVQGVCRVCNVYWELIPAQTLKNFITKLVLDLAWDGGSADVRAGVLKGISHLLDSYLSHPLLKNLLPELKNLFHDTSEKVRVAFTDLLLKVKGIKSIKFWHIVPLEHILARIEVDNAPVVRRLVALIFNSYMPMERDINTLVHRCVTLIQNNPGAARKFYQYARRHMTVGNTGVHGTILAAKYMLMLCKCILVSVRAKTPPSTEPGTAAAAAHPPDAQPDFMESFDEEDEEKENIAAEAGTASGNDNEEDEQTLSADNTELMRGMIEAIVILRIGVAPELSKAGNADVKKNLEKKFSMVLPEFFRYFQDSQVNAALILLAGFLPPNSVPTMSRTMLSKLKAMTSENSEDDYGTMLESMCKWGKSRDILELITDWLEAVLLVNDDGASESKKVKPGRTVTFAPEPLEPKPLLALDLLSYTMRLTVCREILLNHSHSDLNELAQLLAGVCSGSDLFVTGRVAPIPALLYQLPAEVAVNTFREGHTAHPAAAPSAELEEHVEKAQLFSFHGSLSHECKVFQKCIEKRLVSSAPLGDLCTDAFLVHTFEAYLKLQVLLHDPDDQEHSTIAVFEQLLIWADVELVAQMKKRRPSKHHRKLLGQTEYTLLADPNCESGEAFSQTMSSQTLSSQTLSITLLEGDTTIAGQKRNVGEGHEAAVEMATSLIQVLLTVASNMLLVGVGDHELASHLADFAMQLLQLENTLQFLPLVSQLMYQITECTLNLESANLEGDEGVGSHGDIVPGMLSKVVGMLAQLVKNRSEQAERILPSIKPAFGEMLSSYYKHNSLNRTLSHEVMSTIMAAVVANMTHAIKKDSHFEARASISELPTLTTFLLSTLWRRTSLISLFLEELNSCLKADAIMEYEGLCGVMHLLHTISKGKSRLPELKECVTSVELKMEEYKLPEDTPEDAPLRHLLASSGTLLKECKTGIGMVA